MNNRLFPMFAATALTLFASGSAVAAQKAPTVNYAKMDCAALKQAAMVAHEDQLKVFSKPPANPMDLVKVMRPIQDRASAIHAQREAKKCPDRMVIDNNDLGK